MSGPQPGHARPLMNLAGGGVLATLAAGLLVSAAAKSADFGAFSAAVRSHGLLPLATIDVAGSLLVCAEAGVASMLLAGLCGLGPMRDRAVAGARWMSILFALLALYCGAMAAFPPPLPVSCGCGLRSAPVEDWTHPAVLNASLSLLALGVRARRAHPGRGCVWRQSRGGRRNQRSARLIRSHARAFQR